MCWGKQPGLFLPQAKTNPSVRLILLKDPHLVGNWGGQGILVSASMGLILGENCLLLQLCIHHQTWHLAVPISAAPHLGAWAQPHWWGMSYPSIPWGMNELWPNWTHAAAMELGLASAGDNPPPHTSSPALKDCWTLPRPRSKSQNVLGWKGPTGIGVGNPSVNPPHRDQTLMLSAQDHLNSLASFLSKIIFISCSNTSLRQKQQPKTCMGEGWLCEMFPSLKLNAGYIGTHRQF